MNQMKTVAKNSNVNLKYSKKVFLSTDFGKLMVLNQIYSNSLLKSNSHKHSKLIHNKQSASQSSQIISNNSNNSAEKLKPQVIFDIQNITDNTSTNFLYTKLKDEKFYCLFNPSSHFGNSILLYKSLKKKLFESYFGTTKKPLNPFKKCNTSKEIFHLTRNIKTSINSKLAKIGYVLYKNGEVNINHKDNSVLQNNLNMKLILTDFIKKQENNIKDSILENDKFSKYDYFIHTKLYEGVISANSYIQKGIPIKVLGDKKIYPLYGVFLPTRQDYLELFDDFFKTNIKYNKSIYNAIDLGCGTGILSFIIAQHGINRIFSVDNNNNCIISTTSNAQTLDVSDKVMPILFDIQQDYFTNIETHSQTKITNKGNNLSETLKSKLLEKK